MEILEVSYRDYHELIKSPYYVYGSASFNYLNKDKCDELFYLLFREGKYRLGLIGGLRENSFVSPISAPFGGFSYLSEDIRLQHIEEAIKLLVQWIYNSRIDSVSLTLPPSIYGSSFLAKQLNCLWRAGFELIQVDLNYYFDLSDYDESYPDHIWYNARKNLRIAIDSGLEFIRCNTLTEKELAYEIIKRNRESRGFPLRMSWEQVRETVKLVESDFFVVNNCNQESLASAIVFHAGNSVVQVVYWGDLQGYSELKPMNYISSKVFGYYKSAGKRYVDIGPSTEHSLPNYGLCEFKEGIGCRIEPKYTLVKKLV